MTLSERIAEGEQQKSIASLVYWKDGVDKARIERWLKKLEEQGYVHSQVTREYNSLIGEPVWYIP